MNPGRSTRSGAFLEMDTLPDDPSQTMAVIFHLLKYLQARSVHTAESQGELSVDLIAIKAGQEKNLTDILAIQKRLEALEARMNAIGRVDMQVAGLPGSVETLTAKRDSFFAGVDDLECDHGGTT